MAELPAHTDTGDTPPEQPRGPARRTKALWIAAGVAVLALVLVLHLTGVFTESHG